MSAQVTEAHRKLAADLCRNATGSNRALHHVPKFAQLIADSEARACDQLRAEVATCNDALEGLVGSLRVEVERWELAFQEQYARAASAEREVERLKRDYDYDHKCLHEVRERCELWKQRAERAEAELHALRLVCGTTDADKFSTWVDRANARAERAEADADSTRERALTLANSLDEAQAEIAAERARLDWLMAGGVCMVQHSGGFYVSRLHAQVSRAVIDSAMKEGSA